MGILLLQELCDIRCRWAPETISFAQVAALPLKRCKKKASGGPLLTCRASSRSRGSKRKQLYDSMRSYADHFRPLLKSEQELEHKKILEQSQSSQRYFVKKRKRLYGSMVYALRPIRRDFRRGDLVTVSDGCQSADASVLSAAELLITAPIGSMSERTLAEFSDQDLGLTARAGVHTLPYERAENALDAVTAIGPATPALARLLVSDFQPPDMNFDLVTSTVGDCTWNEWEQQAKETVNKVHREELALLIKRLPLNKSQRNAIVSALSRRVCLIQGPPGTGKTITTAHLISAHVRLCGRKVLACASSNVATDNLLRAMLATRDDLDIIRIGRVANVDPLLWPYCLESVLEQNQEVRQARQFMESGKITTRELFEVEQRISIRILKSSNVVIGTCISCGKEILQSLSFPVVVVDEATQATETDVLIPLVSTLRMPEQMVLVGDHHQLPPTVLQQGSALSVSLFTRLCKIGVETHLLDMQYRMHPSISEFPARYFYFGKLKDAASVQETRLSSVLVKRLKLPSDSVRSMFCDVNDGIEEKNKSAGDRDQNGTSILNQQEAETVGRLVECLCRLDTAIDEHHITVISPYSAQVRLLSQLLGNRERSVEVCTVDGFQGRESNIIIFSCVRSNAENRVGFLKDWRRLNVAITRARQMLIVVGNYKALRLVPHWREWLMRRHIISDF